jgi:hypothetical protein
MKALVMPLTPRLFVPGQGFGCLCCSTSEVFPSIGDLKPFDFRDIHVAECAGVRFLCGVHVDS